MPVPGGLMPSTVSDVHGAGRVWQPLPESEKAAADTNPPGIEPNETPAVGWDWIQRSPLDSVGAFLDFRPQNRREQAMDRKTQQKQISRRRFLKDVVLGGAAVGAGLTMMPGVRPTHAAKKGVYTMKYDCYIGATAETAQLDNWFLDEIVKRSDGKIQIKKFWSGSLHKVGQHLPAIRDGLSEISLISYGYYPSAVPLSGGRGGYYGG